MWPEDDCKVCFSQTKSGGGLRRGAKGQDASQTGSGRRLDNLQKSVKKKFCCLKQNCIASASKSIILVEKVESYSIGHLQKKAFLRNSVW